MPRFTHHFDFRIAKRFTSDIEDFDKAFDAWVASFPDDISLRTELLTSDKSTKSLLEDVLEIDASENNA